MSGLSRESRVFSRYLLGRPAEEQVLHRYEAAVRGGVAGPYPERAVFDRLLTKLARAHPSLTRVVDIYTRHFNRAVYVRKRLILMLAILESYAPSYAELDRVDRGGRAAIYARMTLSVVASGVLLVISALLLTPLRIALPGRRMD